MVNDGLGWKIHIKKPIYVSLVGVVVVLLIITAVVLIRTYNAAEKRDRETITFGVSLVGAAIAITGVLRAAESIRASNSEKVTTASLAFVQRWNSPGYLSLKTDFRELNEQLEKLDANGRDVLLRDDGGKRVVAVEVLNLFEEMATGINNGSLNGSLLREYMDTILIRYFDVYEPWIKQHRIRRNADGYFEEIEKLAKAWKKFPRK